ncbi:MAG: hypothetical protein Q9222_007185, partial [Ikaeria aurantiellina]
TTYPNPPAIASAKDIEGTESVFIASSLWNSGNLLQEHWVPALLQTVKELKAANIRVFVSIYENGSWDSTKSILSQLKKELDDADIRNQISLDDKAHKDVIKQNDTASGWLQTAHGVEMRRIPYLASVRNEALKPLVGLTESGQYFDRLIYINDVVFSIQDVEEGNGVKSRRTGAELLERNRFRGIPDSLAQHHVEASECCLVHYDNPLSRTKGVYINPAVRVAYSAKAYAAVSTLTNNGKAMVRWPARSELMWGYWRSKWSWWMRDPGPAFKIGLRTYRWKRANPTAAEPGLPCLSDLAMVLASNGWAMRGGYFE